MTYEPNPYMQCKLNLLLKSDNELYILITTKWKY